MEMIVAEISSFVNERPLGTLDNDVDMDPITPNLLATGRPHNPLVTPSTAPLSTVSCKKMWIERRKMLNHFWEKWQTEYLSTLSIDKKWPGVESVVKPGDVVILRPETLEKNQWRLARIIEIHRDLNGVATTATVRLPIKREPQVKGKEYYVTLTRTLRQMALLESSALEYERQTAVKSQSSTESTPRRGVAWNEEEHAESVPSQAVHGQEEDRPRSSSRPRSPEREPQVVNEHPEAAAPTAAAPDAGTVSKPEALAHPSTRARRRTRMRQHKGFYKKLHEGEDA